MQDIRYLIRNTFIMRTALTVFFFVLVSARVGCFVLFGPHISEGEHVSFTSVIGDFPQVSMSSETFTVFYGNAFGSVPIRVTTKPSEQLQYEKMVKISGNLTYRVLRGDSKIAAINSPVVEVLPSQQDKLMQFVIDIRKGVEESFQKVLSANSATLLLGIVLGGKGNFINGFQKSLQTTGVMHIIAASGMNVTMVGGFFFTIFSRFFRRQHTIFLVGCIVGFYVLLAGMQPSILRAGMMMLLALTAQFFGRQYDGIHTLFLAAGGMILFSPVLVWDVGFQLSVAATTGIVFLKPYFPKHPFFDDISTTTAAQIATLPIVLTTFGHYGLSSILVNFLILWTIPFLMILGGLGAICSFVLPPLSWVFIQLAAPLLWYMEEVIDFFSHHSVLFVITTFPIALTIGYYFLIISCIVFLHYSKLRQGSKSIK